MVRIIKQGKLPGERKYEVVCRECRTEFEFLEREAQDVPDRMGPTQLKIACPLCHNLVYTPKKTSDYDFGSGWYDR